MKDIRIKAGFFAAIVLFAGCSKIQEEGADEPLPVDNDVVTVITAGFENTKTELQSDGKKVYWQDGDAISVNGIASAPVSLGSSASSAEFIFNSELTDPKKAVYPSSIWSSDGEVALSAQQEVGTDISFGQNALPMVAYTASGNSLTFKTIAAIIKIQLKAGITSDTISYVEFSGNNNEQVSGVFSVDYSTGVLTATSSDAQDRTVRVNVGKTLGSSASSVFVVVPPGNYSNGFTVKVVDSNGFTLTKQTGAVTLAAGTVYPTPVLTFQSIVTINDFAKEYVKILDVWENNVGTINRVSNWALAASGDEDVVENAHYVPNDYTITVGGKTYTTGDMLETALRSYLLLRGWDGNATNVAGWGAFTATTPVSMSETSVPETHNFTFGTPLIESSNGGYLYKIINGLNYYGQVDPVILDNWAQRSLNFPLNNGLVHTNMCGYPRDPVTNYGGCFSSGRALITYAFFFKYMIDNGLDKADALGSDVVIRSELFGLETADMPDIKLNTTALSFGCENQTQSASFDAYTDWNATPSDSWITVSPSSGSLGKVSLDVTVAANSGAARTGKVVITGGDVTEGLEITVSQAEKTEEIVTIKDFAEAYVGILDVWENTTGTIDLLTGENYTSGSNNVSDAHYVPSSTTIIVGGKTYNTADMFETALRSYLLVRGYNGLDRTKYGAGTIAALSGGAVAMSETEVPETHGYTWGANPYNETSGNGGFFHLADGTYHAAKTPVLDNWAMRALNYNSGKPISNLCGYNKSQLSGYAGCFCAQRALITYAFFFKYMLDNNLDKADGIGTDVIIRSELTGKDGNY